MTRTAMHAQPPALRAQSPATRPRARLGMILPVVMIAMLLASTLAATSQMVAWRAARGARTQWDSQRALYAADAGIVAALAQWNGDSIAQLPVGRPRSTYPLAPAGISLRVTWVRTSMLRGHLHAAAEQGSREAYASTRRIHRIATRAIALAPPPLPVRAAATFLGGVHLSDTLSAAATGVGQMQGTSYLVAGRASFDGRDPIIPVDPKYDDCGELRDTASVPAVAIGPGGRSASGVQGSASQLLEPSRVQARVEFELAWPLLMSRATTHIQTRGNASSGIVTDWPGGDAWTSVVMEGAPAVTVAGHSSHVGLLVVDGDLVVRGQLAVTGALVVAGALHVDGGDLRVRGAMIVGDRDATGSQINGATTVQYAPCLLGRALLSVSLPRTAPFHLWNSP